VEKTELERLFQSVEKNLAAVSASVQQGLNDVVEKVGADLSKTVESLGNSVSSSMSAVASATENSMNASAKQIASTVAEQVQKSDAQWKAFMDKLEAEAVAGVKSQAEGLDALKAVALSVAEKAQAGSAELSQNVSEKLSAFTSDILAAFQKLSDTTTVLLQAQKSLTESIDNRVVKEKEASDALGTNIVQTAELMRVNQSELSANLEMLRAGLETILEKLSGDTEEREEEDNFVEHLNQSLEAFHERASEVLMENAVKTQEILLEVMEQIQRAGYAGSAPKGEGK